MLEYENEDNRDATLKELAVAGGRTDTAGAKS